MFAFNVLAAWVISTEVLEKQEGRSWLWLVGGVQMVEESEGCRPN